MCGKEGNKTFVKEIIKGFIIPLGINTKSFCLEEPMEVVDHYL